MIIKLCAAAVLAATALSACSTSTNGSGSAVPTGVAAALAELRVHPTSVDYDSVEYADIKRERQLGIVYPASLTSRTAPLADQRWSYLALLGIGLLHSPVERRTTLFGLNPYRADWAITAGEPPDQVTRLDGTFEATKIQTALTSAGAKPRRFGAVAGLSFGADNAIPASSPLQRFGIYLGQLDQIVVNRHEVVGAANAAAVKRALGGTTSLLDRPDYTSAAHCLGDVIAARIESPPAKERGNSRMTAVGVRDPGIDGLASSATEVLCLLPAAGKADIVRQSLAKRLRLGAVDPMDHVDYTRFLSAVHVDTVGSAVRAVLTIRPQYKVGYLLKVQFTQLIDYWDGTCAVYAQGQNC